ncbi:MAG: ROK family transcriptional regulator, partial [Acidimicrobiales bacterium]
MSADARAMSTVEDQVDPAVVVGGAGPWAVPMGADHGEVKRNNMEVVLRHLAVLGRASRAAIASRSGLTRTTLSRLVTELMAAGLVREVGAERTGQSGRPGTLLELDGRHVLALGAEINVDCLTLVARNLGGDTLAAERRPLNATRRGMEESVAGLANLCHDVLAKLSASHDGHAVRVVGLGVAIPGLVDVVSGVVFDAPNLRWRGAPIGRLLSRTLGWRDTTLSIGNDANFGALAEYRIGSQSGTANLVYVTGEVGIGAGVIVGGQLLQGPRGYAGEVGHVSLDPHGPKCGCGRRGCWESMIGLNALFRAVGLSSTRQSKPEGRVRAIADRAQGGDTVVMKGLEELGYWVGIGAGNLVNILGTEVVILGGYFPILAEWILPAARRSMAEQVMLDTDPATLLTTSQLGFDAAAIGASIHVLEDVFSNPP